MKEIAELSLPEDARYTKDHEWARREGERVRVGISDFAQDRLGDVVYVELPVPGDVLTRGQTFGTVESVKAVSELYAPMGGEVLEVNRALEDAPQLVNESPHGDGWMMVLRPADPAEWDELLPADRYRELLAAEEA